MACTSCVAARETAGAHLVFDRLCLWCGARYIQQIPARGRIEFRPVTQPEANKWRRHVLRAWMAFGHLEQELRALAGADAVPLEPRPERRRK